MGVIAGLVMETKIGCFARFPRLNSSTTRSKSRRITIGGFAYSKDKNNRQNRNKRNLLFIDAFRFSLKHPQ